MAMFAVVSIPSQTACDVLVMVNGEFQESSGCFCILAGDSVELSAGEHQCSAWFLITPIRTAYSNLSQSGNSCRLGIDSLLYTVRELDDQDESVCFTAGAFPGIPEYGTFYVGIDLPSVLMDTLASVEPLHRLYPEHIVQFAVRGDDTYMGFLMELLNTPFIMAPRSTPLGNHQADDRLGCDCAAFAVYGKRREGFDYRYLGPAGILDYLEPVYDEPFYPFGETSPLYRTDDGTCAEIREGLLQPGCILHFGEQVSVFYSDRGIEGLLDAEDLLIQSWFDGPHFCTVFENGFFGNPVMIYRWADENRY